MHTKFIKYLIIFLTPFLYAESIVIDAKLDEPDWDNALVINDYYETVPFTLAPAKVKTITKILSFFQSQQNKNTSYNKNVTWGKFYFDVTAPLICQKIGVVSLFLL